MDRRKANGAVRHAESQAGRRHSRTSRSPSSLGSQSFGPNGGKHRKKRSSQSSEGDQSPRLAGPLHPGLVSDQSKYEQNAPKNDPVIPLELERVSKAPILGSKDDAVPDQLQSVQDTHIQELNIAVLGSLGTGKSTFIKSALDLKVDATSSISTKKVSLEGRISIVRLIEINADQIQRKGDNLGWPEMIEDSPLPELDGVLLLFDVTNSETIEGFDGILEWMSQSLTPLILVSTKCDTPPKTWQVTTGTINALLSDHQSIESFQTALRSPETHKRCISVMLRNIMLQKHDAPLSSSIVRRPRAATGLASPSSDGTPKGEKQRVKHSRAVSDISTIGSGNPTRAHVSPTDDFWSDRTITPRVEWDSQNKTRPLDGGHTNAGHYNYSTRKDFASSGQDQTDIKLAKNSKPTISDLQNKQPFLNNQHDVEIDFAGLVDRLLKRPTSKDDTKFLTIFLCFYPKFAQPTQLMREIIRRFEVVDDDRLPDLCSIATRLRYFVVLHQWIRDYPCDFSRTEIRTLVSKFLSGFSSNPLYATAYAEICNILDGIRENDNVVSYTEHRRSRASTIESLISSSSTHSTVSTLTADSSTEDSNGSGIPLKTNSSRTSGTPSSDSTFEPLSNQSSNSGKSSNDVSEEARQQTSSLKSSGQYNLDKIRWHQLMDLPEEQLALELTRIDWILYSAIRPRDLMKHISLGAGNKDASSGLEHVGAIVEQFNHVAMWVANLILLRDKPKHRALMLEKFLAIAWRLRYLNNYNSLGAVIAGINGTAVHRLAQTRALVSSEARKQFMRLEILMGTSKSHSAYRLGWQNTSGPRIPFLPLHLRDLVSAEAGNKTVLHMDEGEKINWRKFEVMGEVILGIQESQSLPYPPIKKNNEVYNLIMGCKFSKDEDELFNRSVQLEGQDNADPSRRKFGIFQR